MSNTDGNDDNNNDSDVFERERARLENNELYPRLRSEELRDAAIRVHRALHKVWTATSGPGYVKADWRELDNAIEALIKTKKDSL